MSSASNAKPLEAAADCLSLGKPNASALSFDFPFQCEATPGEAISAEQFR